MSEPDWDPSAVDDGSEPDIADLDPGYAVDPGWDLDPGFSVDPDADPPTTDPAPAVDPDIALGIEQFLRDPHADIDAAVREWTLPVGGADDGAEPDAAGRSGQGGAGGVHDDRAGAPHPTAPHGGHPSPTTAAPGATSPDGSRLVASGTDRDGRDWEQRESPHGARYVVEVDESNATRATGPDAAAPDEAATPDGGTAGSTPAAVDPERPSPAGSASPPAGPAPAFHPPLPDVEPVNKLQFHDAEDLADHAQQKLAESTNPLEAEVWSKVFALAEAMRLPEWTANQVAGAPAEAVLAGEYAARAGLHAERGEYGDALRDALAAREHWVHAVTGAFSLGTPGLGSTVSGLAGAAEGAAGAGGRAAAEVGAASAVDPLAATVPGDTLAAAGAEHASTAAVDPLAATVPGDTLAAAGAEHASTAAVDPLAATVPGDTPAAAGAEARTTSPLATTGEHAAASETATSPLASTGEHATGAQPAQAGAGTGAAEPPTVDPVADTQLGPPPAGTGPSPLAADEAARAFDAARERGHSFNVATDGDFYQQWWTEAGGTGQAPPDGFVSQTGQVTLPRWPR